MSCPNFSRVNARNFYVIYSTCKSENIDGNEVEIERDFSDLNDLFDCICERIQDKNYSRVSGPGTYSNDMDGVCIAENINNWYRFGNGKNWLLDTEITKYVYAKDGHYSGINLDWDITINTSKGDVFSLSEYDSVDDLVSDLLSSYCNTIDYYGEDVNWNRGTFNFQKKNIEKWIRSLIDNASDELDEICKNNCEDEFYCAGIFSNGEAIYRKVS